MGLREEERIYSHEIKPVRKSEHNSAESPCLTLLSLDSGSIVRGFAKRFVDRRSR
jgi:hypothetical protein